jgi:hypothetical protein
MCPLALVAAAAEGAGEATGGTPWGGRWALTCPSSFWKVVSSFCRPHYRLMKGVVEEEKLHCRAAKAVVEWRGANRSEACGFTCDQYNII